MMDECPVPRGTEERLREYLRLLCVANEEQNLVSKLSLGSAWERHVMDAVQLGPLVRGDIADIGSGAGLPGIVLAILGHSLTLVEPRRKRFDFLCATVTELGLDSVKVVRLAAAQLHATFDTITARAVAPLDRLLGLTHHLAHRDTRWVLPKGKSVHDELEVARTAWHGRFELVPSITDPAGMIVVAEDVRPRPRR